MSGHTELPWEVSLEGAFLKIRPANANGSTIAQMTTYYRAAARRANAALIVDAVNTHAASQARIAELTAALSALLEEAEHFAKIIPPYANSEPLKNARRALTSAGTGKAAS